jgi:hypothetical protein
MKTPVPVEPFLAPEDLALLQTFLEAWCIENSVSPTDPAARQTASALIDWYQKELRNKTQLKESIFGQTALPRELEDLLEKLAGR